MHTFIAQAVYLAELYSLLSTKETN